MKFEKKANNILHGSLDTAATTSAATQTTSAPGEGSDQQQLRQRRHQ